MLLGTFTMVAMLGLFLLAILLDVLASVAMLLFKSKANRISHVRLIHKENQ